MNLGAFVWRATFTSGAMRPLVGEFHKHIVANVVDLLIGMGVPEPISGDVGCHCAMAFGDKYVVGSRSASCDEESPVVIEIIVNPQFMMDNIDTIGKAFATLPSIVKKAVQKARDESAGNFSTFSETNSKPQLLN